MDFQKLFDDESLVYPRPVVRMTNLIFGIFLLLIFFLSLMIYWTSLSSLWKALGESISQSGSLEDNFLSIILNFPQNGSVRPSVYLLAISLQFTALVFTVVFFRNILRIFLLSVMRIGRSILQLTSSGTPEGIPVKYSDVTDVLSFIGEKNEYRCNFSSPEMISVFGYGVQYISPAAAEVAASIAARVLRAGKNGLRQSVLPTFLGIILAFFLLSFANWDFLSALFPALSSVMKNIGSNQTVLSLAFTYTMYVLVVFLSLFLDWLFVKMLSSRPKPPMENISRTENAQVAIAPYLLSERFQQDLESIERSTGRSDRVYRTSSEAASVSMNDMGRFALLGLVEHHPRAIGNPNFRAGLVRLWSGWAFILIAAMLLTVFLLPSSTWDSLQARKLTEWKIFLDPVTIILVILAGNRAWREGIAMVASAEAILESYWFEAPSLRYDIRGVTAKSEIQIGAAQDDSIKTSSSLARSEFIARLTATNLVSEVASPSANRKSYSMAPAEECLSLIDEVRSYLRNLSDLRPAPIGIDLSRRDVLDTIDANAAAQATKKSAVHHAKLRFAQPKREEKLPPPSSDEE